MRMGWQPAIGLKFTAFFWPHCVSFWWKNERPLVARTISSYQYFNRGTAIITVLIGFIPDDRSYNFDTSILVGHEATLIKNVKCSATSSKTTLVPSAMFRRFCSSHVSSIVEYHIHCCNTMICRPIGFCGLFRHNSAIILHLIELLPTDQVIIMISNYFQFVFLWQQQQRDGPRWCCKSGDGSVSKGQ